MSLSVFLSCVTGQFGELRKEAALELRKFRNLSLSPIIQEDLSESSLPNGTLVDKLVSNIRNCRLVICFVGLKAGYPKELEQRVRLMQLVENRLEVSFRRSPSQLGKLWEEWRKLNLGMTYTQLEFFVASAFAEDTRLRVLFDPNEKSTGLKKARQTEYVEFLRKHSEELDWSQSDEPIRNVVELCVEFGLQLRDASSTYNLAPTVSEAVERGLVVLENLKWNHVLTNESYVRFYEKCVLPRLTEPILTNVSRSTISEFSCPPKLMYAATNGKRIAIAGRSNEDLELWVFQRDADRVTLDEKRTIKIPVAERLEGLSIDGSMVLTWSQSQGYGLRKRSDNYATTHAGKLNVHSGAFDGAAAFVSGSEVSPIVRVSDSLKHRSLDFKTGKEIGGPIEETDQKWLVLRSGHFRLKDTSGRLAQISLMDPWDQISPSTSESFLFRKLSSTQFSIDYFATQPLASLFLCMELSLGNVIPRSDAKIEVSGYQANLVLNPKKHDEIVIPLPHWISGENRKGGEVELRAKPISENIPLQTTTGRYGWTSDREFLIALEEQVNQSNKATEQECVVKIFHFPRFLVSENASKWIEQLRRSLFIID